MFTLKFIKNFPVDSSHQTTETIVSCEYYEKNSFACGKVCIMVRQGEITTEYRVASDFATTQSFQTCYIENSAGKTIDKIHFDIEPDPADAFERIDHDSFWTIVQTQSLDVGVDRELGINVTCTKDGERFSTLLTEGKL